MKDTRRWPFWNVPELYGTNGPALRSGTGRDSSRQSLHTHTAVAAGFDRFAPALIKQYLGGYAKQKLGISLHDLLALGRRTRMTRRSLLHGLSVDPRERVGEWCKPPAREGKPAPFSASVPRWPKNEVPIGHVTNGVHTPTWDSAPADDLWTEACGKDRWLGTTESLEQDIRRVSDTKLWQFSHRGQ